MQNLIKKLLIPTNNFVKSRIAYPIERLTNRWMAIGISNKKIKFLNGNQPIWVYYQISSTKEWLSSLKPSLKPLQTMAIGLKLWHITTHFLTDAFNQTIYVHLWKVKIKNLKQQQILPKLRKISNYHTISKQLHNEIGTEVRSAQIPS